MYLILPTKEAEARNRSEAKKRKCDTTTEWWDVVSSKNGDEAALVVGDCDGLTDDEKEVCVKVLPENFITEE